MSAIQPFYEMMPYEPFVLSDDDEDGSDDGSKDSGGSASKQMYWQDDDWVPTTAKGTKQKTPQQVRTDLQKHVTAASDTLETLLPQLQRESTGVTEESLRLFWDLKKHYKSNAWEAEDNPVYLAGARLLERIKYDRTHQRQQSKREPKKEVSDVRPSSKLIRRRKRKAAASTCADAVTPETEEGASSPTTVTTISNGVPTLTRVIQKKKKKHKLNA